MTTGKPMTDRTAQRWAEATQDVFEWAEIVQGAYSAGKADIVKQCVEIVRKRANRQRDPQEIRSIHRIRCVEAGLILAMLDRLTSEGKVNNDNTRTEAGDCKTPGPDSWLSISVRLINALQEVLDVLDSALDKRLPEVSDGGSMEPLCGMHHEWDDLLHQARAMVSNPQASEGEDQ